MKKKEKKDDVVILKRFNVIKVHPTIISLTDNQSGTDLNPLRLLIDKDDAKDLIDQLKGVVDEND
ncbi:hypothetical protein KY333_03705 [Candidatus Woesearchaeota archaeon]|nr:hypothetical protein [Candidatus Woesearchaeota archaeon]